MAMIDTMSIMGIRSFGPGDESQQVIKFQHPLTLIVGPNGAGKTTIIECLRYATTGEHPLNTKGGAFVHDPKVASLTEVKAKVRLKCKSVRGNEVLVERSMTATYNKKSGMKFKTLEGLITKMINDEKVSISSKCANLNKEMVLSLGVSKAVLDNVIFCHQEESNWPLSEGKSVKQRFDEIFAATRYIKALEEIRKIQRDHKNKRDIEETQLKHLKANTARADDIKSKLTNAETNLNKASQSKADTEENLVPVRKRLEELSQKRAQVIKLEGKLGALKSRKDQMIEDKEKLESRINNLFHETDEQLFNLQADQEQVLGTRRQKQMQCERRIRPLQDEINRLTSSKTKLSVEQGKLEQEVKNASDRRRSQSDLIKQTVEDTGIHVSFLFGGDLSSDNIEEFENKFNNFKLNELKQMKHKKADLEQELKAAENEYQNCWKAKTEMEGKNRHKADALRDTKMKLNETNRELKRVESSGSRGKLDDLQQQIATAQQELKKAEVTTDFDAYQSELEDLTCKRSILDSEMKKVDNDIFESQKTAQIQTKIELLEKDKLAKERTLEQLKSRNEEPLSQLGLPMRTSFPNQNQLRSWIAEKDDDLQQTQQEFSQTKATLSKLSAELEMTSKQVKQKRTRSSELDESLFEICGSQDLKQDLTRLESDIKKLQGKKGLADGIQHMYKKFIDDMTRIDVEKKEVTCPLCQRLFDETSEVDDLISQLEEKLEVAPKKLENQAKELEKKQARYKVLQENKPLKMELDRLNETEIPDLEKSTKSLQSRVNDFKQQVDVLDSQCTQMRKDENTARNCMADVARIDALQVEIRNISRELIALQRQLPSGVSRRSIDELQAFKKNVATDLFNVNKAIDEKKAEIQRKTNEINQLRDKVNNAQEEKFRLAADLQKTEQLKEKQKSFITEIEKLQNEINDIVVQLAPISDRVESASRHKVQLARKKEEATIEMNRKKQELDAKFNQFEMINRDIQRFEEAGIEQKLKRTTSRITESEQKIEQANEALEQSHEEVKKLHKELATCTDRQRDLEDNIALRERKKEIEEVEVEFGEMKQTLQGMDVATLERESRRLTEQHHKLNEDRISFAEKEVRYREEARALGKQLNEDEHKNAEKLYRECLVKCSILELTTKDLEKYYKALDRAIMKYHQIKMEEINKIIKELWQETYRGSDIDYIQICSDEDTGSNTSRRVFNYRVVMFWSGVPMDMRGRCSAGQKVLASLVIRLALAETFCINCGILALDEPTTNLDRDNIESLAKSLVSIIESRSRQRNFQLVIITHDEDFVDLLGRSKYVDHFFRIQKDERSHSRIYRCPIQEIAS